ncbi:MAG TPA: cupin-like domain-containing protein [Candidatus Acidoferrales bacterium]|nr:cupin-like domain-containing protein [Candidatus Acidoferrales bacterium]
MSSTALPAATLSIERRHKPAYAEFVRDFMRPLRPVIITGALDQWKARHWTPEYFQQKYPDHRLTIDGKAYRMADFIDLVLSSNEAHPAPYLRSTYIYRLLPELLEDVRPLPEYFSPNWFTGPLASPLRSRMENGAEQIYIGGKGGKFPFLHYDGWHTHAFLCQLYGTKEFTVYPEDQAPYLYVKPTQPNSSMVSNLENPDLQKFPLFAKATPTRFRLEAGEILFVPSGLWHTAKMLSPSITVSVNRANASNWSSFRKDLCSSAPGYMKPAVFAYLTALRVSRFVHQK